MHYQIQIARNVKKFIDKQDKNNRKRIYEAISALPNGDIKKMQTRQELYRLRIGEFRFVYKILQDEIIIVVIDGNNRGDIYKKYK